MNKLTFLARRTNEWRLLRDVSPVLMLRMEAEGWWIQATWLDTPSLAQVLGIVR
jgi:hypothetical protein